MSMFQKKIRFLAIASFLLSLGLGLRLASGADEETLGQTGEKAGKFREALTHYVSALGSVSEGSADDQRLREKIISVGGKLDPPPAVPEEGKRFMVRGETFFGEAKNEADYREAAMEFEKALRAAPWWPAGYFNLGLALEGANEYDGAIRNFKLYLLASPNGDDAERIRKKIYALEAKSEKARRLPLENQTQTAEPARKLPTPGDLVGFWRRPGNEAARFQIEAVDGQLVVSTISLGDRPDLGIRQGEKTTAYYLVLEEEGTLSGPPPTGPFGRITGKVSEDLKKIELEYPSYDSRMPDSQVVLIREE